MARKDAANKGSVLEQYRKRAGQHNNFDFKKQEKEQKKSEGQSIEKGRALRTTGIRLLIGLPIILLTIYTLMYMMLTGDVTLITYVRREYENFTRPVAFITSES